MPLFGSNNSQIDAMRSLLDESGPLIQAMTGRSVVSEENRSEITAEIVDTSYFYLGLRANASLEPLRILVDGQAIALPSEDHNGDIVRAVCILGYGFFPRDLAKLVPHANPAMINEVLSSLAKAGFLDFVSIS